MSTPGAGEAENRTEMAIQIDRALEQLAQARPFAKGIHQTKIFGFALKLLKQPDGLPLLYGFAPRFDTAGLFHGGDWARPAMLQPRLVRSSLRGHGMMPALECMSALRFLAIANGDAEHPDVSAPQARAFLEAVLALNLDMLFPDSSEAARAEAGPMTDAVRRLFRFIADSLGYDGILASLVFEAERLLLQRPIMIGRVQRMLETAGRAVATGPDSPVQAEALKLIHAAEGPTELSRSAADAAGYAAALATLDPSALHVETTAFAGAMRRTGLVCPLHAVLLRFVNEHAEIELGPALGLGTVGQASLAAHGALVRRLIDYAVRPETARCIYGLSRLLERGTLFFAPVAPGLRRLIGMSIRPEVAAVLQGASPAQPAPPADVLLLAGTLSVLGQPLGVDQGDNPTCQAARAISLWAQNSPGQLLELIARAARDGDIVMQFEGDAIVSSTLELALAEELHTELDPISLVLVPHLDRVYMEMGQRVKDRVEDGHKWVNPEMHGPWVYRGFAAAIDPVTAAVSGFEAFIRLFYATYHPDYNNGAELCYPQPAGVAVTNAWAQLVGWHAVSIQRVGRDPAGDWRVYFYNPNHDSGQDWGQGIVTSTADHNEYEGEGSLPFEQFASRLYVFHYNLREQGDPARVPADTVAWVAHLARYSWAAGMG